VLRLPVLRVEVFYLEFGYVKLGSLRHILASPGYASGTIAVNVTWMKKRVQCLSNASQHVPIYLQPFPSNSTLKLKSSPFWHTFLHILASPGYAPGTFAVNVTWMERGFNAGQTHSSIYPSIFNRLQVIARYWSEIATFSYPLAFSAPFRGVPIGIPGNSLILRKLESWAIRQWRQFDDRLSRFDTIPACEPISITCAVWLTQWRTLKCNVKLLLLDFSFVRLSYLVSVQFVTFFA